MKCWEPGRPARSLTCEPRPLATDTDCFTKSHFFEVVPCGRPLSWSLAQIPVCQTLTFGSRKESHWQVHISLQALLWPQVYGLGFHQPKCVCFSFWLAFSSPGRAAPLFWWLLSHQAYHLVPRYSTKGETWTWDGEGGKEHFDFLLFSFIWEAVPRALWLLLERSLFGLHAIYPVPTCSPSLPILSLAVTKASAIDGMAQPVKQVCASPCVG